MKKATRNGAWHPVHNMCTYLGSFPPRTAAFILDEWVNPRTVVADPFCGAGTTLVEAALRGHPCVGIDLNPLAIALSKAKTSQVQREDVLERIQDLAYQYSPNGYAADVPEDIEIFFHKRTLDHLCYLREELNPGDPEDAFLQGCILGIMHGKFRKDGSTAYLSIDMPNTFSMSPNYVRRFVRDNGLEKPPVDVFRQLSARVEYLFREGSPPIRNRVSVLEGDATQLPSVLEAAGYSRVGAIVTSPPYLGVLRYGAFNWIRLWFLGYEPGAVDRALDGTDSMDVYLSFMATFLASAAKVLRKGALLILVIGDVEEGGQYVPLALRLWEELGELVPFELVKSYVDDYDAASKTTRIWGDDKKGNATPFDRVMVLERTSMRNGS